MKRYNLLTTWRFTNRLSDRMNVDYYEIDKTGLKRHITSILKLLFKFRKYNAFLAANPTLDTIFICFLAKLIYPKTLIIAFDILLMKPETSKHRILARIERILFIGIDKFFCNHKDITGYERYYGINKKKLYYVPFKANNYHLLSDFVVRDKGYVLANGASYRDYGTFLKAMTKLGYPTKIVLPGKKVAKYHHTILPEESCPENVTVIRHDFNAYTWNTFIADARIVVVPIKKGTLQSAGVSVYLEAMALGKPVIVTEGISTKGLLTKKMAEIVPPADPDALAAAIKKLWEDEEYRKMIARTGQQYALALKGADRMIRDILIGIYDYLMQRQCKSPLFQ